MKLGPDMYYLNTFNIAKHDGVSEWVGGRHNQKITRKCQKIASSETNLDNAGFNNTPLLGSC